MNVLDASALLAFVQDERGAQVVEEALEAESACSAANWSEVAQKVCGHGRNWDLARSLLLSYDLDVEAVTIDDAELAAQMRSRTRDLSLGDRLCLALGDRLDAVVWTADRRWGSKGRIHQIR